MTKTAIILFNLGGPDSQESIRPFLKNFFMDKNIIQAPWPVRHLVSHLISTRRSKKEAGTSYGFLGHKSPLLENTLAQSDALQTAIQTLAPADQWKTFTAMRYWHPRSADVVKAVKDWAPDRIALMPLYPQFSTTTTGSSIEEWDADARKIGLSAPATLFCCYPRQDGYIAASARLIRESYEQFQKDHDGRKPRLLFSAHGLPEKIIARGDPYQWQCQQSAQAIAAATGIDNLDWQICYQSRVGPMTWIGPSTDEALHKAAADKVPVMLYPHAFVSEHVETLVEIEIEYRHLAHTLGIPGFARVPTVSTAPEFIDGLARMILDHAGSQTIVSPVPPCPVEFSRCCRNQIRKVA